MIVYAIDATFLIAHRRTILTLQTFYGIVFLLCAALIYRAFDRQPYRLAVLLISSIVCYGLFSAQMLAMLTAAVSISYIFGICRGQ